MKSSFESTGLKSYKAKRNFRVTPEPKPVIKRKTAQRKLLFVIQKHDASHLHYDFRLEMEGVLKSWAVPKGLPTKHGEKHLAIEVEDHPFDYAHFEGTIPRGNYGGGTVMVWDTGTYSVEGEEPLQALKHGKLHLTLAGKKLKGEWALVRLKPRPGQTKEQWLFFKSGDDAKPISAKKDDESVLSGRSMKKIAGDNDAQWKSNREEKVKKLSLKKSPSKVSTQKKSPETKVELKNLPASQLGFVEPMKCLLAETPPNGDDWIFEIKFDGFRALAIKDGKNVQLLSRANKDLSDRFPEAVEGIKKLPCRRGIFDGEIVALDKEGKSSFQLLQVANMPGETRAPICFYLFDLLNLEGKDLKNLPLTERKSILEKLLSPETEPARFSVSLHGDPEKLLEEVRNRGLEGIIAKLTSSKYEVGRRSGAWKKIKVINEQEFVIGGYTPPKGSRNHFGALLVGFYQKGKFIFASKVGTGFNHALLKSLYQQFQKIRRDDCPFANLPEKKTGRYSQAITASEMKKCLWVEPKLVCQINFTEWTRDNHLRHPVFLGLREDKKPTEVVKEKIV